MLLTKVKNFIKPFIPARIWRALRVIRQSCYFSRFPDRVMLIDYILPRLSKPGSNVLWVGCQAYTQPYLKFIERKGAICWTLEIDPTAKYWGHPQRHTIGDLRKVSSLYLSNQFDVALVNGVFGYGLDTPEGQNEAIEGLSRVLRPNGILMLGWDLGHSPDPVELPAIEQFFVRSNCPDFKPRTTFAESPHVYDFFTRQNSVDAGSRS
jgi:SAM-dependent methyltransferase